MQEPRSIGYRNSGTHLTVMNAELGLRKSMVYFLGYERAVNLIPDGSKRVLNIGAGYREMSIMIKERHLDVELVSVDGLPWESQSIPLLEGEIYHQIDFEKHMLTEFGKFDAVFAIETLEHLNPESTSRVVQECSLILNDGGILHVSMPPLRYFGQGEPSLKDRQPELRYGHLWLWTEHEFVSLLFNHGFTQVESSPRLNQPWRILEKHGLITEADRNLLDAGVPRSLLSAIIGESRLAPMEISNHCYWKAVKCL